MVFKLFCLSKMAKSQANSFPAEYQAFEIRP